MAARRPRLAKTALPRERRDVASGNSLSEDRLIRLALSPEGRLVPDTAAKLPGRGVWVACDRLSVEKALKKKAFSRSLGEKADAGDDLAGDIEAALTRSALALISLARRAGELITGFDQVRASLKTMKPACLIEASDAAADGQGKLVALWRAKWGEPVIAPYFDAEALGAAIGRDHAVHLLMAPGGLSERFLRETGRLSGFRPASVNLSPAAQDG